MDIKDNGTSGQYARNVLKKLFTVEELSGSILYPNDTYAKPGLDTNRMKLFKGKPLFFFICTFHIEFFSFQVGAKINIFFFNVERFHLVNRSALSVSLLMQDTAN